MNSRSFELTGEKGWGDGVWNGREWEASIYSCFDWGLEDGRKRRDRGGGGPGGERRRKGKKGESGNKGEGVD